MLYVCTHSFSGAGMASHDFWVMRPFSMWRACHIQGRNPPIRLTVCSAASPVRALVSRSCASISVSVQGLPREGRWCPGPRPAVAGAGRCRLAIGGQGADRGLGHGAVACDGAVFGRAAQPVPTLLGVADGLGQDGFGRDGERLRLWPGEETSNGRGRFGLPQGPVARR